MDYEIFKTCLTWFLFVLLVIVWWKIFVKAGQPGWKALIPIYDYYIFLKIAGCPGWWIILYLIPIVNLIIHCVHSYRLSKSFGKGEEFAIGMMLLGPIFWARLAYDKSQYKGEASKGIDKSQEPTGPRKLGIASLILGILSILMIFLSVFIVYLLPTRLGFRWGLYIHRSTPYLRVMLGVIGIVLSTKQRKIRKEFFSLAGLITSIIGTFLGLISILFLFVFLLSTM